MNSYHVLELVGEGSFGRVYKGRKKHTGQVVALKFMPKVGRSEKELRSLKREIEIMRDLQHPNIVQLFDSFETEAEVVVVTEYAEGQLFQILEDDGSLPESQVRDIACQLVSALYYLHSHRILHRDMKPQNILLGKGGVVKLCDFGFARSMSTSTLVLTSIKGTPLYMSPELVEEKPYDHTSDLWSLGCILYELHTGTPPFYTNSIFHLVQLIVRDQVKWPDTMSETCTSFLKGLLTKDPEKRLSWPDLLHHPFVADGVLVLAETNVIRPLTVTPSPETMALKLQQVAEKSVSNSGRSRLLRNTREQRDSSARGKPVDCNDAKVTKDGVGNENVDSSQAAKLSRADSVTSAHSIRAESRTANKVLNPKTQACVRSKPRGQISIDYEREFLSVEVNNKQTSKHQQDADSEEYWEKLAQESDESKFDYNRVIPQLKAKILVFKFQLTGGSAEGAWQIRQPLKVLRNLLVKSDLEKSNHIGQQLGLPHVLFDVVHGTVENSGSIKRPWSVSALGEIITVLVIYWDKHPDWIKEEDRLEEFTKPFLAILSQPDFSPLSPLAASVLCLFTQHTVDVKADVNNLTSLLQNLLSDSYECHPLLLSRQPLLSLPSGWGLCDGLLSLLLHTLSEHANGSGSSSLDPVVFLDLWKKIGTSLAKTPAPRFFCSANGLFSFLSTAFLLFIKDPYSCIPLFSESRSKCVNTLGQLLGTGCLHLFAEDRSPRRFEVDPSHDSMSALSCRLLCFPFALDLPSHTMSTILRVYDSCSIVESLTQVIQTLPPPLLELPLSLLSRLLLYDPERSVSHLRKADFGLFLPPGDGRLAASKHQAPRIRTAGSLLCDLLQPCELWDSAAALLNLLSQVARCSARPAAIQLHLNPSVLHQALDHPYYRIRAATCRFLDNVDPFRPPTLPPDVFKIMIRCLHDSSLPVRRTACRAVSSWLGYIAASARFKMGRDATGWSKGKKQNKHKCSDGEPAGDMTTAEQGIDDDEGGSWVEEARRTVALLTSLIADPDPLTRRHCCVALGNVLIVDSAVSLLLEDVSSLLLRAACADSHNAVRRAAVATLCHHSEQDAIRQVLISLNASDRLLQASQHAPAVCDYQQLIGRLSVSPLLDRPACLGLMGVELLRLELELEEKRGFCKIFEDTSLNSH